MVITNILKDHKFRRTVDLFQRETKEAINPQINLKAREGAK